MQGYDITTYGERIADMYDDLYDHRFDVEGAVHVLAELADTGHALELAIGTGRIALPLAARGVTVDGIDCSPAMVERLRAKPGGHAIDVTMGDFADVAVPGRYRVVYLVFNTLFALLTQDDQVRCFANVAEHLTDDGVFVVEAFVPDLGRFHHGQSVTTEDLSAERIQLSASRHDAVTQRVDSSHVFLGNGEVRVQPIAIRYAWPSELDLMARLAGLRLVDRWAGWRSQPFQPDSGSHVSVYANH